MGELPQCLVARVHDCVKSVHRSVRISFHDALAPSGLNDHQADAVGHNVVQLTGNPGALGAHRQIGQFFALRLELPRAIGQLDAQLAASTQRTAREPWRQADDEREDRREATRG